MVTHASISSTCSVHASNLKDFDDYSLALKRHLIAEKLAVIIAADEGSFLKHRLFARKSFVGTSIRRSEGPPDTQVILLRGSIRAVYIFEVYRYIHQCSAEEAWADTELWSIIVVVELSITLMYLDNHYHDGKMGVTTTDRIAANRLEYTLLENRLNQFISQQFSGYTFSLVRSVIDSLFRYYEIGIRLDSEELSLMRWEKDRGISFFLSSEIKNFVNIKDLKSRINLTPKAKHKATFKKKNFLDLYLSRSFLINGVLFQLFTDLLLDLHRPSDLLRGNIHAFSRSFGLLQQLVNDTFDYIPIGTLNKDHAYTTSKIPEDTFNDTTMRLLTLPIQIMVETGEQEALYRYYRGEGDPMTWRTHQAQVHFLSMLRNSGSLGQSMSICANISKNLETRIDTTRPGGESLLQMGRVGLSNGYFRLLNQWGNKKE